MAQPWRGLLTVSIGSSTPVRDRGAQRSTDRAQVISTSGQTEPQLRNSCGNGVPEAHAAASSDAIKEAGRSLVYRSGPRSGWDRPEVSAWR